VGLSGLTGTAVTIVSGWCADGAGVPGAAGRSWGGISGGAHSGEPGACCGPKELRKFTSYAVCVGMRGGRGVLIIYSHQLKQRAVPEQSCSRRRSGRTGPRGGRCTCDEQDKLRQLLISERGRHRHTWRGCGCQKERWRGCCRCRRALAGSC
jgi:hypothetical protein